METENELTKKIAAVTLEIQSRFPELMKYISEMPATVPDEKDPEMSIKKLEEYYNTLEEVVRRYKKTH